MKFLKMFQQSVFLTLYIERGGRVMSSYDKAEKSVRVSQQICSMKLGMYNPLEPNSNQKLPKRREQMPSIKPLTANDQ